MGILHDWGGKPMKVKQPAMIRSIPAAVLISLCFILLGSAAVPAWMVELVSENEYLELYFNSQTTSAVYDDSMTKPGFPTLQDRAKARAAVRDRLSSQVVIFHGAGSGTERTATSTVSSMSSMSIRISKMVSG